MTDRASIFQGIQLGVESTHGTGVAADKQLLSLTCEPTIEMESSTFKPTGHKYPTIVVPNREWTSAKLGGPLTYGEIVYLLSSVLEVVTPARNIPSTGLSYTWTFNPAQAAADTVKTFTVEQGDSSRAHKFTYGLVTELGIAFSRNEITLDGAMIGQRLDDDITMTATPTAIEVVPVLPGQGNLYLSDTQAGLAGASALDRGFAFGFKIGNRFGPIWPIKSTATSFDGHVETEPSAECTLLMEADDTGMGLLTNMRAGSTKWARIQYLGDTIETIYKYKFQIDVPLKITKVNSLGDQDGIYAVEYTAVPAYDATWAKPFEVVVVNKVASL